jgi:hypothetical protein
MLAAEQERNPTVPVVVHLSAHKSKAALTVLRELFLLAAKGKIAGFRFEAEMSDGTRKTGTAGKCMPSCPPPIDRPDLIALPLRHPGR